MLFNSFEFLLFLPIVFLLYWFVFKRLKWQNLFLVVASYVFYGWWDWRFLILIALTTLFSYVSGRLIARYEGQQKRQKALSAINIVLNLSILGVFKYYNFFAENFAALFGNIGWQIDWVTLDILLPVGISFYTFQALSYSIDVYQKKLPVCKDIIAFFAYISFFPQLVAGPIERATNLLPQFYKSHTFNYAQAVDGCRQILWGFFKKMVVADNCATAVNLIWGNYTDQSGFTLLMGGFLFTLQIYGDFSGYSDIAIGTARLFGINLMRNFSFPYFSRDIAEFWRRWHISLTTWFRDYIYIPLGGSRCARWTAYTTYYGSFSIGYEVGNLCHHLFPLSITQHVRLKLFRPKIIIFRNHQQVSRIQFVLPPKNLGSNTIIINICPLVGAAHHNRFIQPVMIVTCFKRIYQFIPRQYFNIRKSRYFYPRQRPAFIFGYELPQTGGVPQNTRLPFLTDHLCQIHLLYFQPISFQGISKKSRTLLLTHRRKLCRIAHQQKTTSHA